MKPSIETKAMSYDHAHEDAVSMGYPSLTEALEHLDELRQSSAVLPSEAITDEMVAAGIEAYHDHAGDLNGDRFRAIYTAMRAATPTAPVQDDDAELRLRDFCCDAWGDKERLNPSSNKSATMGDLRKLLSRLSQTPETGLVEARPQGDAGDAIDWACGHARAGEALAFLDDWRMDRADEWPEYMKWVAFQHKCAAESKAERSLSNVSRLED